MATLDGAGIRPTLRGSGRWPQLVEFGLVRNVGFDLDMTLVDSAAAILDAVAFTCGEYGRTSDPMAVRQGLGLPLDQVFRELLPAVPYEEALTRYRARYLEVGIALTTALPGAHAALAAVRSSGGRTLVVSAKHAGHVAASLAQVGLDVDEIVGELFGAAKAGALLDFGAAVYVGDHPGDVAGALAAGAIPVGVTTGPTSEEDLAGAGAAVVWPDLGPFPDWNGSRLGLK